MCGGGYTKKPFCHAIIGDTCYVNLYSSFVSVIGYGNCIIKCDMSLWCVYLELAKEHQIL